MSQRGGGARQQLARRAAWGFADQALSSLSNFAVGILVARSVDPAAFGSFSLAFVAYTVLLNVSRALGSTPLVVRFSGSAQPAWRRATGAATGVALIVGLTGGLACLIIALAGEGAWRESFVAIGVCMPFLLVQDAWRFSLFADARGRSAFFNDLTWLVCMVPTIALAIWSGLPPVLGFGLAWGAAAGVAAVAGIFQTHVIPQPTAGGSWLSEQRGLAPRYLVEFVTQSGVAQLVLALIGIIAGLAAVGAIRAGQLLLGPVNVLFMGAELVAVPEAVMIASRSLGALRRACVLIAVGEATVAALWGGILLLMPLSIGVALLGENWLGAVVVLPPLVIWLVGTTIQEGAIVGLRALAAADRSLRARLVVSVFYTVGAIGGATTGGALGASIGLALAALAGSVVWWAELLLALIHHERASSAATIVEGLPPLP